MINPLMLSYLNILNEKMGWGGLVKRIIGRILCYKVIYFYSYSTDLIGDEGCRWEVYMNQW